MSLISWSTNWEKVNDHEDNTKAQNLKKTYHFRDILANDDPKDFNLLKGGGQFIVGYNPGHKLKAVGLS